MVPSSQAREFEREELLIKVEERNLQAWAASGSHAAALLMDGTKVLMTVDTSHGSKIVHFNMKLPRAVGLKIFWMNESSVKHIGEAMRANPGKRMNFSDLLAL